jgi:hypothetical protein
MVDLPTAANKDIQRWLLSAFCILPIVVTIVVVVGGGKKTQAVPSALLREGSESFQRRLGYYCKAHTLSGMHFRSISLSAYHSALRLTLVGRSSAPL